MTTAQDDDGDEQPSGWSVVQVEIVKRGRAEAVEIAGEFPDELPGMSAHPEYPGVMTPNIPKPPES